MLNKVGDAAFINIWGWVRLVTSKQGAFSFMLELPSRPRPGHQRETKVLQKGLQFIPFYV